MSMSTKSPTAFTCLLCAFLIVLAFGQAGARQRILFDAGWRFQLQPDAVTPTGSAITGWKWTPADSSNLAPATNAAPGFDTSSWKSANVGDDVFHGRIGFAWFRAVLPDAPNAGRVLTFTSVDDNADVYVNGVKLFHHEGWSDPFDVEIDSAWHKGGPNVVAVLVENTDGPGGIYGSATLGRSSTFDYSAPAYNDAKWRVVHLPHDYVIEGAIDNPKDAWHGGYTLKVAWYRKTFTLPASDRGQSIWVDFDGVYRDSDVYLNGKLLGKHPSGYTSFRYDIGSAVRFGAKNILAVRVNPRNHEGWWYEGGGIYRHVWLNIANPVHIAPWGTFVTSSLPEPGPDGAPSAALSVTTQIVDAAAPAGCTLSSKIFDAAGKPVAQSSVPIAPAGGDEMKQTIELARPHLWSLDSPYLYSLQSTLTHNGKVIDQTETPFGVRTIRFDPDNGFFLNGKNVKIQGVCNHQDYAGVGIAVPDTLEAWRVAKLKEMGCNGWRMSHNPPTPELLDACDRLGMLVMDESRHLGDTFSIKSSITTPYADLSELKSMIVRDRNHPSIIMWSMCNEEGIQGTPQAATIFQAMMNEVHKYDTTRPISCAMNGGWFNTEGIASVEDLMGVNYSYNVYDKFHPLHPKMPIFGSETASTVTTRGEYVAAKTDGFVNCYNLTDTSWKPIASRPFVAGSFAWTGFDYKGEPSPFNWPNIHSNFGIMDMCGFPKDNYYYYQSWWKTNPVVHIMPHWNWAGKEGQPIRVIVFSNCDSIELFANGASLGSQDMPRNGHLEWRVPYAPGSLTAKGTTAGKIVAQDTVQTTGAPASIALKADRSTLDADGEDVIPVEVDILDSAGRVVPTADNHVTFHIEGAAVIAGVGNGNPIDHDPDTADYTNAFNGKCVVVVKAVESAGKIHLTAKSDGLTSASFDLTAK